jgi:hypothetical protein
MLELPMVGAIVALDWQQIHEIAKPSGCKEVELGEPFLFCLSSPKSSSVKEAIINLQQQVATLERNLSGLGPLVG